MLSSCFGNRTEQRFRAEDIGAALGQSNVTAYNYLHRLERAKCVEFENSIGYKLRRKSIFV